MGSRTQRILIASVLLLVSILIPVASRLYIKSVYYNKENTKEATVAEDITYEMLVEANSQERILEDHTSILMIVNVVQEDNASTAARIRGANRLEIYYEYGGSAYCKADFTGFGYGFDSTEGVNIANTCSYYGNKVKKGVMTMEVELSFRDWRGGMGQGKRFYSCGLITDHSLQGERIVSVTDNDDGTLTIITNAVMDDIYRYLEDGIPIREPDEINPYDELPDKWRGAIYECEYIVEKETLLLKTLVAKVRTDDGVTELWKEFVIKDGMQPIAYRDLCRFCTVMEHEMSDVEVSMSQIELTSSYHCYRVVYDGTDESMAIVRSVLSVYKYDLRIVGLEGYDCYEDPAGKVPYVYDRDSKEKCTTIYAIKKSK